MRATVRGCHPEGVVIAPPSKSYTQRAVACSLLADGRTEISNPSRSDDALSALGAARTLGAGFEEAEGRWVLRGGRLHAPGCIIDCGGSATAMRIFTAIAALAPPSTVLSGDESLRRRPMAALLSAMNTLGAPCFSMMNNGYPPVAVRGGGIEGGTVMMRGDVSSQYLSALLIACTGARKNTTIGLTTPLESRHYVEMTLDILEGFGSHASADFEAGRFEVAGGQPLRPCSCTIEGDYSSAAFFIAAGLLGGRVELRGLNPHSRQGDRAAVDLLKKAGGAISASPGSLVAEGSALRGFAMDARQIPDLVPIMAVVASQAEGTTVISGVGRLVLKESDRVRSTLGMLRSFGAQAESHGDAIVIRGGAALRGARIDPWGDHRIAMASAIAALVAEGETVIENAGCVFKSYPSFFDDLTKVGVEVELA